MHQGLAALCDITQTGSDVEAYNVISKATIKGSSGGESPKS